MSGDGAETMDGRKNHNSNTLSGSLTVSVFAGHTGGHLFPAIAFSEQLRKKNPGVVIGLVTSPKAKPFLSSVQPGILDRVDYLNEFPFFSGISLRTFHFLLEFARAFGISSRYLSKVKPDLCVGFGSYVSYPGIMLSVWKKIPTLIHEQNKIPGKATKMLARHVDCVAESFEGTMSRGALKRLETTGLPIRSLLYEARRNRGLKGAQGGSGKIKILITGGSQGAHRLNEVILECFSRLLPEERKKVAVTHITGQKDFDSVTARYEKTGIEFKTHSFFEKMQELYEEADMAVTRSGANTLFELALFGIPAIAVPYPHAAEGHQEANARHFESQGALWVETEETMTGESLLEKVRLLIHDSGMRQALSEKISKFSALNAAENLADLAMDLLSEEKQCHSLNAI